MLNPFETKIKEIFTSIQGEGTQIGKKHIFVRFCKCNLNCKFCDTDFNPKDALVFSTKELYEKLNEINCETISFTGGEPLMDIDFLYEFLKEYKEKLNKKIYLETNGVLFEELEKIIDFIDYIAMDIKIESATGQQNRFLINEKFLKIACQKDVFIKVVFDENVANEEIDFVCELAKRYNVPLILQPKMPLGDKNNLMENFEKFYEKFSNVQLIPQVHKFLNLA